MSDLFDAPAPAAPPASRRRKAAAAPPAGSPATPPQVMQVVQADPPAPTPRVEKINIPGRVRMVTLHDGRQVDSASEEWRRETLARHLLTLAPPERDEWLAGWPAEAATEMRLLMRAMRARDSGDS